MENQTTEKPQGFSKWVGRIVAAVLILTAIGIALVHFSGGVDTSGVGTQQSQPPSSGSNSDDAFRNIK